MVLTMQILRFRRNKYLVGDGVDEVARVGGARRAQRVSNTRSSVSNTRATGLGVSNTRATGLGVSNTRSSVSNTRSSVSNTQGPCRRWCW